MAADRPELAAGDGGPSLLANSALQVVQAHHNDRPQGNSLTNTNAPEGNNRQRRKPLSGCTQQSMEQTLTATPAVFSTRKRDEQPWPSKLEPTSIWLRPRAMARSQWPATASWWAARVNLRFVWWHEQQQQHRALSMMRTHSEDLQQCHVMVAGPQTHTNQYKHHPCQQASIHRRCCVRRPDGFAPAASATTDFDSIASARCPRSPARRRASIRLLNSSSAARVEPRISFAAATTRPSRNGRPRWSANIQPTTATASATGHA